jgi:hypothetical protein
MTLSHYRTVTRPHWIRGASCAAVLSAIGLHAAWADDGLDLTIPTEATADATPVTSAPSDTAPRVDPGLLSNLFWSWRATSAAAEATQPNWASPLVTTTPLLKQRLRFDTLWEQSGNGTGTTVLGGDKGLDVIVTPTNEIHIALPAYNIRTGVSGTGPKHTGAIPAAAGWGDWAFFRGEQRLAAAPEGAGNYVVTAWLTIQAPSGIPPFTSNAWTYTPTIAFGKGWGNFNVQSNIGVSIPASHAATLGHPVTINTAFLYRIMPVVWPEFEVNWTYYPDGQRGGLNQVFLTPGLILSSFKLGHGLSLTIGGGYQVAVSPTYRAKPLTPSYNHAWIFTTRLNF